MKEWFITAFKTPFFVVGCGVLLFSSVVVSLVFVSHWNNNMYKIDSNSYRSNFTSSKRVRYVVLHYTALNFKDTLEIFVGGDAKASTHYLVPDPTDPTYKEAGHDGIKIFNLVDENDRAWHAGVSYWKGVEGLNDTSIGIEMVNLATEVDGVFTFPPYNENQIKAVESLLKNILQRYPRVHPTNIVAHSDIAPDRKSDPGPKFPWKELYKLGIGAWYDEDTKDIYVDKFTQEMPPINEILETFSTYGYDVSVDFDLLVRAFQMHFRPSKYDGVPDVETIAILYALVEKYHK